VLILPALSARKSRPENGTPQDQTTLPDDIFRQGKGNLKEMMRQKTRFRTLRAAHTHILSVKRRFPSSLVPEDYWLRPFGIAPGFTRSLGAWGGFYQALKGMSSINWQLGRQKNHRFKGFVDDPEKALLTFSYLWRPIGFRTRGHLRTAVPIESDFYGSGDSSRFYPQNQLIFELYGNFVQQLL
jgi:hypothetical protein